MKKFVLNLLVLAAGAAFLSCDPEDVPVELTCTVAKTDVTFFGGSDGTLTVTVITGNEGYEYSLASTSTTTNTTGNFTGLVAGEYLVSVKDSKNKTYQKDVTIDQAAPSELSVTLTLDHVTCHNGNNGKITVTATGGILTYVYKLGDGNYQDGNAFESLTADDYTVTVKSGDFVVTKNATIKQPAAINATHSVVYPTSPGANGTITISATGGTTPYQYKLNDGEYQSSNIFNPTSGTHIVTVTDANNCGPVVISNITLTDPVPPTITTDSVTNITTTTAIGWGNSISGGGVPVTGRGVVWSTSEELTLESNSGYTTDGEGTGEFESLVTELTPLTTYYLRAYASNNFSTSYGETFSFTTSGEDGPGDAVTDIEGNTYNTVWINNKLWMAENLKTTKYNSGLDISNATSNSEWTGLSSGAYCWHNNDEATYKDAYGGLYNWYAVNTGNLCPSGWHVPTDAEWTALTDYVGGASVAGTKLKATSGWNSGGNGTDEYGFSALPGGARAPDNGSFGSVGYSGDWWGSTEIDAAGAWARYMGNDYEGVYRFEGYKRLGCSVRCVRD